uniref:Uncharacterized protein n=1 Tax=Nelumbo nucifera TaxID=4432 RepID=A0A822ZIV8_NELNU|nr:TPA_asm: hypothetical protein HUJ06_015960 [Nelumbo nucifera]
MNGVGFLKDPAGAKPATKVLLALCLAECNRHVAVEAEEVAEVVETVAELEGSARSGLHLGRSNAGRDGNKDGKKRERAWDKCSGSDFWRGGSAG